MRDAVLWPLEDNRIPREIFTDPDLFRTEMDAAFTGPVWVLVGHESKKVILDTPVLQDVFVYPF